MKKTTTDVEIYLDCNQEKQLKQILKCKKDKSEITSENRELKVS